MIFLLHIKLYSPELLFEIDLRYSTWSKDINTKNCHCLYPLQLQIEATDSDSFFLWRISIWYHWMLTSSMIKLVSDNYNLTSHIDIWLHMLIFDFNLFAEFVSWNFCCWRLLVNCWDLYVFTTFPQLIWVHEKTKKTYSIA